MRNITKINAKKAKVAKGKDGKRRCRNALWEGRGFGFGGKKRKVRRIFGTRAFLGQRDEGE